MSGVLRFGVFELDHSFARTAETRDEAAPSGAVLRNPHLAGGAARRRRFTRGDPRPALAPRHGRRVRAQRELGGEAAARLPRRLRIHAAVRRNTAAQRLPVPGTGGRRTRFPAGTPLPHPGRARPRRHGCRLQGRGSRPRPHRCPEVPARGAGRPPAVGRAVRPRGANPRFAQSPRHLRAAWRRGARGPGVPGHGVPGRASAEPADRGRPAPAEAGAEDCRGCIGGARGRARHRDRAPRHRASQHLRDRGRTRQDTRLRPGGDRTAGGGQGRLFGAHAGGARHQRGSCGFSRCRRFVRLHVAGADPRRSRRRADRRVFAGRGAVRDAVRQTSLPRGSTPVDTRGSPGRRTRVAPYAQARHSASGRASAAALLGKEARGPVFLGGGAAPRTPHLPAVNRERRVAPSGGGGGGSRAGAASGRRGLRRCPGRRPGLAVSLGGKGSPAGRGTACSGAASIRGARTRTKGGTPHHSVCRTDPLQEPASCVARIDTDGTAWEPPSTPWTTGTRKTATPRDGPSSAARPWGRTGCPRATTAFAP